METKYKIAKYAGIVIIATIFCRILGLGREIVISNRFGAGIETDAFFIAFMIPNLLRSFLGEGALNSAFIPIFAEYLTNNDRKKAEYFASNVLNILIIILIIVVILGIWGAPLLINIIAIGFKSNMYKYQLAITLTRIIFPYVGFVAVAALFMGVKKLLKLLIPAMIVLAITQINVIVDRTIASTLIDGSISALYYSNRLVQFPLGAFGIAISIAIFPTLAKQTAENDIAEFKKSLLFGLKMLLFITIPSAVGLIVLKDSLIRLIYEHGMFSRVATNMTASALLYYSIGLFAYACARLITMSFYALKDTKTPVKIGIFIVFINIALDLILVKYLAHSGLALATSVAAILNLIILLKVLQGKIGDFELKSQLSFLIKIIISSIFLGIICVLVSNYFGKVLDLSYKYNQIIQVTASIFSGGLVYFIISYMLDVKEVRNLRQTIKTILRSKN